MQTQPHIFLNTKKSKSHEEHYECLHAFAKGSNGIIKNYDQYEMCEIAILFGVFKKYVPTSFERGRIISNQIKNKKKIIIIDQGFIRKDLNETNYYSVGFDSIIGWGNYKNNKMDETRFQKLGIKIKDWRQEDKNQHILLCGQVPWDASCQYININQWLVDTALQCKQYSNRKIIYRPHPKALEHNPKNIPGCVTSHKPIEEDLKNAYCTIVYNSNSSVDSLIQGVPVICLGQGCVASSVSSLNLERINHLEQKDRRQWLNNLAYTQWNIDEMRFGHPWKHLMEV